ncbi:999_t:CDS:1 [Acaulospora colombiana]|uniref:999_t:CDS:1 n=1 Tax=Acaulospora colombiana TaxID=27376 RepID=A0ACA9JVD8_9GLOM|nr:999_t:CDS:1 [Acaulospora colombiana]
MRSNVFNNRRLPQGNSTDSILTEKLNKLLNRLAKYFKNSKDRIESVKPEDEKAQNLEGCFEKMELDIKVTIENNNITCLSCGEMDTLSNINNQTQLQEDKIKIVQDLLKKLDNALKCKFEI